MPHQFDSGLFVNSRLNKEWHGLGTVVAEAPRTTAEAMRLAGMDWSVEESPVITVASEGEPTAVEGWKVLRRSDTKTVLHVCRDSWTPVQNSVAFEWFDPIIADGDVEISAAVSLQGGKRTAITVKIKGGIEDVVKGDPVEAFLLLYNSHDGTLSLGIKFTRVRTVCANTLELALREKESVPLWDQLKPLQWNGKHARIRHTKSILTELDAVRDALDIQRRTFRYSVEEYRAMSKVDLSAEAFDRYLSAVFRKQLEGDRKVSSLRQYEQLVQNFEGGIGMDIKGVRGTLWGAYNAITQWTTHQRGGGSSEIEAARSRLNSLWFGSGAQINQTAHDAALTFL